MSSRPDPNRTTTRPQTAAHRKHFEDNPKSPLLQRCEPLRSSHLAQSAKDLPSTQPLAATEQQRQPLTTRDREPLPKYRRRPQDQSQYRYSWSRNHSNRLVDAWTQSGQHYRSIGTQTEAEYIPKPIDPKKRSKRKRYQQNLKKRLLTSEANSLVDTQKIKALESSAKRYRRRTRTLVRDSRLNKCDQQPTPGQPTAQRQALDSAKAKARQYLRYREAVKNAKTGQLLKRLQGPTTKAIDQVVHKYL